MKDTDCPPGGTCHSDGTFFANCSQYCSPGGSCADGYICDPSFICRPRCDNGFNCGGADPICDTRNQEGKNGDTLLGPNPGLIWCYGCVTSDDCPDREGCNDEGSHVCAPCRHPVDCSTGACLGGSCVPACDAGRCPGGQICDTGNAVGFGADLCYECLSPLDCPDGQGCNGFSHTCGTCEDGNDCPPGDFCSNYWARGTDGACLQTCDVRPCPADHPICAAFPGLSNDHSFCFGCLQDSDCADAGPGAWCDTSVNLTFSCQLPVGP